eukprot:TRINITY_DN4673_c0_g1_i1.p1 TRINITY_DN4673_c0_g1~~TRINITY_DN4673_c0_g1_i1.p1  ORF type:complete len:998 (+),score=430.43 TRINITY_DN4673_c0_g1_i1:93-2996(+)
MAAPTAAEGADDSVEYLKAMGMHDLIDELLAEVLKSKPDSHEDAVYEIHSAAAEMYRGSDLERESVVSEQDDLLCGLKKGAEIGRGSFGRVYKALGDLGIVYAVKVSKIPNKAQAEGNGELDARAEYATLRQLSHRNIVRVWDFLVGPGLYEIVMSYWTQGSVAHQIREFGALPPYTVRKYAVQALLGLEYLHKCTILHRDLKPANMLVDCMGSVALSDFGLSSLGAKSEGSLTIVGSPPYVSPGIAAHQRYTAQSDFWALGCSLLEMATARICWSGADFGNDSHGWNVHDYLDRVRGAPERKDTPLQHIPAEAPELPADLKDFIGYCFEAENKTLKFKALYAHPFLGVEVAPEKFQCAERQLPYYRFDRSVKLSGPVTLYLSQRRSLLNQYERAAGCEEIMKGAVAHASPFSFTDIRRGPADGQRFNNTSVKPELVYPHRKRPAHTLLSLLDRTAAREDIEPGLPHVELASKLVDTDRDTDSIRICAKSIDAVSLKEKNAGLSPDPIADVGDDPIQDGAAAAEIYGDSEFDITVGELKRLVRTTYVSTASGIPAKFFQELVRFTADKRWQLFWSAHRAVPLIGIGDLKEEQDLLEVVEEEVETAHSKLKALRKHEQPDQFELLRWEGRRKKAEAHRGVTATAVEALNPRRKSAAMNAPSAEQVGMKRFLERFDAWRQHCFLFPYDLGFSSSADAKAVLDQSLSELSTAVCVSQQGYFLVDGCDGHHNQLTPKTPQPVTFLFASGIDFLNPSTTLREAAKYFNAPSDGLKWGGFLPIAPDRLRERIKDSYRAIFTAAKHHGVRDLSMLPMGLGQFLSNIEAKDQPTVREMYFKAQFELLAEEEWGFDHYYLNPGPARDTAIKALEEVLGGRGEEQAENYLGCDVIIHSCDAKFLAAELAKRRRSAAVLSPSDCASVTMGQIGTFWETGRGAKYSGEEDFISTTTGVLARQGIAEFWGSNHDEDEEDE